MTLDGNLVNSPVGTQKLYTTKLPQDVYARICLRTTGMPSHLVLAGMLHHLVVDNFIHHLKPFHGFLLRNADVLLLKRHRPEWVVKEVETTVEVNTQEPGHVSVVGQSCRQRHQPHVLLRRLYVTNCPVRYKWKSIVTLQLNLKFKTSLQTGRNPSRMSGILRVTTLQTLWNSLTFPWQCAALMPMLSGTHIACL